jgi:protein TonB
MKTKLLKLLFKIFSFLADKTNGAKMFVKPKLWLGTLILGIGVTACTNSAAQKPVAAKKDTVNTQAANDTISKQKIQEEMVFCYVMEQMPVFSGGEAALMEFLKQNIHYPDSAHKKGIQGKVMVRFAIETDGSISEINVVRSIDPLLDAEAVRVIKLMPKWKTGMQNGEAVRCYFTMPISFRIK